MPPEVGESNEVRRPAASDSPEIPLTEKIFMWTKLLAIYELLQKYQSNPIVVQIEDAILHGAGWQDILAKLAAILSQQTAGTPEHAAVAAVMETIDPPSTPA